MYCVVVDVVFTVYNYLLGFVGVLVWVVVVLCVVVWFLCGTCVAVMLCFLLCCFGVVLSSTWYGGV